MYKITLSDGTIIENLTLNGNNYIAESEIASSVFDGKLGAVTFSNDETEETYTDMKLLSNIVRDGQSWLVFGEKSESEKEKEATEASLTDIQIALAEVYEMLVGGTE